MGPSVLPFASGLQRPRAEGSVATPMEDRWLLLIHAIPPEPAYLRVKVGRKLQKLGAIALKNTVYVLPRSDAAQEDLQWVLREVKSSGGDATLCEARFIDGILEPEIEDMFRAARAPDYKELAAQLRP